MLVSWTRVSGIVLVIVCGMVIAHLFLTDELKVMHFGNLVLSLVGTFVGAWLAFARDRAKDKLDQSRKRIERQESIDEKRRNAINRALFVLGGQQNEINQLFHLLAPYVAVQHRQFRTPAFESPGGIISRTPQVFDDLLFLVDLRRADLLFDLMMEQSRFDSAILIYNQRMAYHINVLQPAFEKAGVPTDDKEHYIIPDLEKALGMRVYHTAVKYSDGMFQQIEDMRGSLARIQARLIDAAEELYPTHHFVKFEPIDDVETLDIAPT